ncbi:hypothetical protein RR46_10594 [Papilio xuthus]|uniref:Mitochondrial import inner membrane translocase subunit Tim21 n=1 Tax=Papilio xuthus TaxID=66420 RepID=A0A194PKS5_PAPXU|nr:hypothetical protein RR46_10594 [Papilio xuthus]
MPVSTRTLVKIAGWGGLVLSVTGFYLDGKLVDRFRNYDYYKEAIRKIRNHRGAVHYLGEPIKDGICKVADIKYTNNEPISAEYCIPIRGPKGKGDFYFWIKKEGENWVLAKAELELKSKPDERLLILKES